MMGSLSVQTKALADYCRCTTQLIDEVEQLAARLAGNPATRHIAVQLDAAIYSAFPDVPARIDRTAAIARAIA